MACFDYCFSALLSMPKLSRYEPNRISLNGKRHYQCLGFPNVPDGMLLPSTTTVLSSMAPVGKIMALLNWRKRVGDEEANRRTRLAANRGSWLHTILEDWFGEEDIEDYLAKAPDWKPYFQAVEPFLQLVGDPILIESAVAWWDEQEKIGYSGTLDMLATMEGTNNIALIDWKTSYKEKTDNQLCDYKRQLGAYAAAASQMYEIDIEEAYCVIAVYDPECPEKEAFLQLLTLDGFELANQELLMADTVKRYFMNHYPGGKAMALTMDRG